MKYGVYDTSDDCWMGDEKGPKLFIDRELARMAAAVIDEQTGNAPGTCEARPYVTAAMRLKDEIVAKRTPLQALQRLEGSKEN